MGEPFLGVDISDAGTKDFSTESAPDLAGSVGTTDNAPSVDLDNSVKPDGQSLDKPAPVAVKPEIPDLDKLERVRWKGEELTRKELEDRQLRHEDYTRKVQQAQEVRKYADNFAADLDRVIEDPSLLDQLKKIYPAQYVKAAERILSQLKSKEESVAEPKEVALPRDIQERLDKVDELSAWQTAVKTKIEDAQTQSTVAKLDALFADLGKKFPEADENYVQSKLRDHVEEIERREGKISPAKFKHLAEHFFKQDHERMDQRFKTRYSSEFEKQKAAAAKAKDIGAGGGVPSAPPVRARTIKEATALAISDAEAGRI